MYQIIIQP